MKFSTLLINLGQRPRHTPTRETTADSEACVDEIFMFTVVRSFFSSHFNFLSVSMRHYVVVITSTGLLSGDDVDDD